MYIIIHATVEYDRSSFTPIMVIILCVHLLCAGIVSAASVDIVWWIWGVVVKCTTKMEFPHLFPVLIVVLAAVSSVEAGATLLEQPFLPAGLYNLWYMCSHDQSS